MSGLVSSVFFGFAGAPFGGGADGVTAAGSGAASALASPPRRGQEKSSARPDGAGIGSPWVSTRTATGSAFAGALRPPSPSRLVPSTLVSAVNGSTGPTAGRGPAPRLAGAPSGAGNATGTTWLDITRRKS